MHKVTICSRQFIFGHTLFPHSARDKPLSRHRLVVQSIDWDAIGCNGMQCDGLEGDCVSVHRAALSNALQTASRQLVALWGGMDRCSPSAVMQRNRGAAQPRCTLQLMNGQMRRALDYTICSPRKNKSPLQHRDLITWLVCKTSPRKQTDAGTRHWDGVSFQVLPNRPEHDTADNQCRASLLTFFLSHPVNAGYRSC